MMRINIKTASIIAISALLIFSVKNVLAETTENSVVIKADNQTFNGETNINDFEGNVEVNYSNITIKSPKASVKMNNNSKTEEALFTGGAYAVKQSGNSQNEIKANIIRLSLIKNKVKAIGEVQSYLYEDKKPVVSIQADSQDFDMDSNIMNALGNVIINHNDIKTHSDKAKINIDKDGKLKLVNLLGSAKIIQTNNIVSGNKLIFNPTTEELIAIGSVYSQTSLEDKTKVSIWSNYQHYDKDTNSLATSGNVKISYKNYVASGPKASFLPDAITKKPNKIIFMGRSKIQEGNKLVEADTIQITLEPKNFKASGNVKTQFTKLNNNDFIKK